MLKKTLRISSLPAAFLVPLVLILGFAPDATPKQQAASATPINRTFPERASRSMSGEQWARKLGEPIPTTTTTAPPTTTTTIHKAVLPTVTAPRPRVTTTTVAQVKTATATGWDAVCSDSDGSIPSNHGLGECMNAAFGWDSAQFQCLDWIWGQHESGWSTTADNPHSEAYGIPQANPGSKMANAMTSEERAAGVNWRTNARIQIRWGLQYIRDSYRTPCLAKSYWLGHGSY